ncbi:N/A [soil metagenome]
MRVLHYLDSINRGGAEVQALDVARNAHRYGIELTVVTGKGGALEDEFRSAGIEFIKLDRKLPVDLFLALQLRKIIRERKIEFVRGFQAVDGIHIYLSTRGLKGVKTVLSFEGFIPDSKNRRSLNFLIPRMSANIVVSRSLQEWLRVTDGLDTDNNFTIVYNGSDLARLAPTGKSLRRELGIDITAPLIGMIANFYRDPRKDQLTLTKALPAVMAEFPQTHCVFVGRTEKGAEAKIADCVDVCVQNNITDRAHFLGSRPDIPDILSDLDISVLSSLQEGFPVTISESMLAGVPMVVSDIGPHLEATNNGEYAEIFPTGDPEILAQKIIKLIRDPDIRWQLAEKSRNYAIENMSIDSHLKHLKELYSSLSSRVS